MTSTTSPARPSLVGPDVDRDRGSITVWLALSAVVMIILVGVAVDLCGQVYAKQRCQDIAAQAARAGGQQLGRVSQRTRALLGKVDACRVLRC